MSKVPLTPENKSKQYDGFPRFKLDTGEKARICLIDADPTRVYTHVYRMPVVVNGKVLTEVKKGRNGDYEVPKTEFVDQYACTGDEDALNTAGLDPKNCSQCAKTVEHPDMFSNPQPRFAQNIIRYKTVPGQFSVADPFQAEVLAWVYSEGRFNTLCDIAGEHAPKHGGSMRGVDLLVGPCKSKDYQNYEIQAGAECEWTVNDERQQFIAKLYKNAKCEDLEAEIAKKASATSLALTWDKVTSRYAQIGNAAAEQAGYTPPDLSGLLDGVGAPKSAPVEVLENSGWGVPEEPVTSPDPEEKTTLNLSSLLDDLND